MPFQEELMQHLEPASDPKIAVLRQFLHFAGAGARLSFADGSGPVSGLSAVVHYRHHRRVSGADVQRSQAQAALYRQGLHSPDSD